MCEKLLEDASVLGLVPCDGDQAGLCLIHHTGNMVVPMLQNLQPGLNGEFVKFPSPNLKICFSHRIEHVAALDLFLQVHLLLLPLIVLHYLQPERLCVQSQKDDPQPLLLHQSAFLNVELLLSFCINLFGFFIRFLKIVHNWAGQLCQNLFFLVLQHCTF